MGDGAPGADDRLPWLESPRAAKPVSAARRARTPLLTLAGLFCFGAIAVMAYLIGRGLTAAEPSAPRGNVVATSSPVIAPSSDRAARTAPPLAPPPLPSVPAPAQVARMPAPPVAAPIRVAAARQDTVRSRVKRKAARPRPSIAAARRKPRVVAVPSARAPAVGTAAAVPRRTRPWPARPFAGPRGRVIQLGAYVTPAQADAAWWRVARAYPYLTTLPRVVSPIGPTRGRPRYYRVRLAAASSREARALCDHLHRIGRGCIVA